VALRFNTALVTLNREQQTRAASALRACTPAEALKDLHSPFDQ
jgi:hypothetical protein